MKMKKEWWYVIIFTVVILLFIVAFKESTVYSPSEELDNYDVITDDSASVWAKENLGIKNNKRKTGLEEELLDVLSKLEKGE